MRKRLLTMSLRLSTPCRSPAGQTLQVMHRGAAGPCCLQPTRSLSSSVSAALPGSYSTASERSLSTLTAPKSQRAWQMRAYAAQRGYAQATEEDYTIQTMPWDAMAANAVSLIGNTGKDVEIKRLETGRIVGNLTLACPHKAGQTTWYG